MHREYFMKLALEESLNGLGYVKSNPLVGAVVVQNQQVVAKGFHKIYGENHAEINAIENALKNNINLHKCTLYVTLEPCNHYGKTPPCTDRIIKEGIPKVVVGIKDPNPLVKGKGIQKLKNHGIIVTENVLPDEIYEVNRMFVKSITTSLPYVSLKLAMTLDGYIADKNGYSKWISSEESRKYVHQLRFQHMAIMIGAKTLINDDPQLSVRNNGKIKATPIRIILDRHSLINHSNFRVFSSIGKNIIFTSKQFFSCGNTEFIITDNFSPENILHILHKKNIQSVMIEGGAKVASEFFSFVDRFYLFIAPCLFYEGLKAINVEKKKILKTLQVHQFANDILWEMEPCSRE